MVRVLDSDPETGTELSINYKAYSVYNALIYSVHEKVSTYIKLHYTIK